MRYHYVPDPHPHILIEEIVAPEVYAEMRFPRIDTTDEWGITAGDPEYAEVLADRGWRALHDELRGDRFVRAVLTAFSDDMRAASCLVDPEHARLVPFTESREEKAMRALAHQGDASDLYTRLDFQSKSQDGYRTFVHLDWDRRVVGGILFFSDADEEGLKGGELALYRDRGFRNDRWCHDPELAATFAPRHNTGVIFLNSNSGFHGPRPILRMVGRRRWLYYTISSKLDVWPHAERGS